jgi:hypothetical protein
MAKKEIIISNIIENIVQDICTCQYRQVNPHSKWLVLELEERKYSIFNEIMCQIIKFFTKEETEEDIKKKNKIIKQKIDEVRRRYGLLED